MNSIVFRNELLTYENNDKDETVITIKRSKPWWLKALSVIFYAPDRKTIILDEIGSEILGMCNQKMTFGDMLDTFMKKYKLNTKEAEKSMMAYMKSLSERGIIAFAIKEKSGGYNG